MRSWIYGSVFIALLLLSGAIFGLLVKRVDWLQLLMLFFTFYGLYLIVISLITGHRKFLKNDCYRPYVSAVIPARNEENVIEATVRSLCSMSYKKNNRPNFEVIVMDDCSTDQTYDILTNLQKELPNLKVVRRSPEVCGNGKSAVLNEALNYCDGELVAVFDADTRVEPDFLKKSVAYLYDSKVGGIQGRVRIYNARTNILTALQEDEFSIMNHYVQMTKDVMNGLTGLGGNGQITKKKAVEDVGGWNELSTTEDFDLTVRLAMKGWHVRYCPEAVLWQEGVETWGALLRQRVRWAEGLLKCLFDYFWQYLAAKIDLSRKIDGVLSMIRISVSLWIMVGYTFVFATLFHGVNFYSWIPPWFLFSTSILLFSAMLLLMWKNTSINFVELVLRVFRYWFYNFVWVVAVPTAFFKCLKNTNSIHWDKTFHKGHAPYPVPNMVKPAVKGEFRESENYSYVEVIE